MNYIIAEIQNDDTLKVLVWNVPENEIAEASDFPGHAGKKLVAIPCKFIEVKSTNYGYNTEVEIK